MSEHLYLIIINGNVCNLNSVYAADISAADISYVMTYRYSHMIVTVADSFFRLEKFP